MKKLKINLLFVFVLMPFVIQAQFSVTGKVVGENNLPIPTVEVSLLTTTNTIVVSQLTDEQGNFKLTANQGNYVLQVKQLATILIEKNINVTQNLNLGTLQPEDAKKLEEVTIVAKKKLIERKVDRLVFNVENSVRASSGDALEALKVTPSIRVQNDAISMVGKSAMRLMVDGKLMPITGEELINYLKTVRATDIKSIEVITTPPAQYDAEGNSGLVNIILKKAKANSWSSTLTTGYKFTTYGIGTLGGNFNYQKDKLSFVASLNHSRGASKGIELGKVDYPQYIWKTDGNGKYYTNSLSSRIGLDYQVTKNWNVGFQYLGSLSKPDVEDDSYTTLIDPSTSSIKGSSYASGMNYKKRQLHSINAHSTIQLDTLGRVISFDFDVLNFDGKNDRDFISYPIQLSGLSQLDQDWNMKNITQQAITNYATQINVTHPFSWINLSYGGKLSFSKTINKNQAIGQPLYPNLTTDLFDYQENFQSIYFSSSKKIKKWELQFGVRMENIQTKGISIVEQQAYTNNYIQFFPTLYASYAKNENNNFSMSYGKRISRPNFSQLNPFKWRTSPTTYSEGNPFLTPTFIHNFQLDYSYKDFLYTKLFYSMEFDNIGGGIVKIDPANYTQITTRLNYYDSYSFGFSQDYIYNKLKWLESQNTVAVFYQHSQSKIYPLTPQSNQGMGGYLGTSNTFTLNKSKTFTTGFDLSYSFPNQMGGMMYNREQIQLSFFSKVSLLDKKLQLTVNAENITKNYDINNISTRSGVQNDFKAYFDSRFIGFNISYKLGNTKINKQKRNISNEEEKQRANQMN
ncbi:hypothetical protein FLACOL_01945 [Flavobacterium columnare]|uniref:Outer membrane beta-barrel family protein n=2 Tax=Flavobacterium TaxID=237 RepID=A0ABW8PKR1_9FLAO|nr:outer membrane beta-barrel family protein [Flavobacterium columnare]SPE77931.1 hypothetical protein FLACOL_01945 [Flavobacterium columnare]